MKLTELLDQIDRLEEGCYSNRYQEILDRLNR